MQSRLFSSLEEAKNALEKLRKEYLMATSSASAWETRDGQSSRSVTVRDPSVIRREIGVVSNEIARMEGKLSAHAFRLGAKF